MEDNNYNGYSLFYDVEDDQRREDNRVAVLLNMMEIKSVNGKVSLSTAKEVMDYLAAVPPQERDGCIQSLFSKVKELYPTGETNVL